MEKIEIALDRLSTLHKNIMRKCGQDNGLLLVHIEILVYLSRCNKYSDTTQALSEYLGQTKGSISQSLKFLEDNRFIGREQDLNDKRIFHLIILNKGLEIINNFDKLFKIDINPNIVSDIVKLLQKNNGLKSFGICSTCKFNREINNITFFCRLTNEELSLSDIQKQCREHEYI